MLRQLSIFAENKKGTMNRITGILREAGININAMVTNDSAEFGIIRMIVSDTTLASEKLTEAGYLCHDDRVTAFYISDECGGLDALLGEISDSNINIEYLYLSWDREDAAPIAVIRSKEPGTVERCLESRGFRAVKAC